jgi:predicted nucleic acid-binding Zn ribbon protein
MSPRESQGPVRLGEVLRDFFQATGLADRLKHLEVYSVWEEIVGPAIARHTRVAGIARHKLHIDVDSAAHLHELRTFGKSKILADFRERLPTVLIQDIVFRPGPLNRT